MSESLFVQNLNYFRQEIRDLKTAQRRGLGMVRFYDYSVEIYATPGQYYDFIGEVADGEPDEPFFIPQVNLDAPLCYIEIWTPIYTGNRITFTVRVPASSQDKIRLKVGLISSSQLAEFRQA